MTDNNRSFETIKLLNTDGIFEQLKLQHETSEAARSAALDYSIHKSANLEKTVFSKRKQNKLVGDKWHNLEVFHIVRKAQESDIQSLFVDPFGCPVACCLPSNSRWADKARRRNMAVCYSFGEFVAAKGYDVNTVWFLTLTVRHDRIGTWNSCSETFDRLRLGWGKLTRRMREMDLEYLFVCEPHESGHPHLHGVVCGASEEDIEGLLTLWTDKYGLGLRKAQKAEKINIRTTLGNTVINYLLKYVLKNIVADWDDETKEERIKLLHWAELVYRKNARTFYMTQEARAWIREKYRDIEMKPFAGCNTTLKECISFGKEENNEL